MCRQNIPIFLFLSEKNLKDKALSESYPLLAAEEVFLLTTDPQVRGFEDASKGGCGLGGETATSGLVEMLIFCFIACRVVAIGSVTHQEQSPDKYLHNFSFPLLINDLWMCILHKPSARGIGPSGKHHIRFL